MNEIVDKEMKICSTCKIEKHLSEFYTRKLKNGNLRYSNECKECCKKRSHENHEKKKDSLEEKQRRNEYSKQYRQNTKTTHQGWYSKIYIAMRTRNRKKFGLELPFTKDEFIKWIEDNYYDKFVKLFQDYIDSDCDKYLCPSIDRIDDYKSYTFDNMQLITWKENDIKGTNGIKNKVSCAEVGKKYCSKTVLQHDIENNLLMIFSSTHEVERVTGIDASLIAKACRNFDKGGTGYAKGYIWKYKTETN